MFIYLPIDVFCLFVFSPNELSLEILIYSIFSPLFESHCFVDFIYLVWGNLINVSLISKADQAL